MTGGVRPVLLFHDADHGRPLIEALARYGDGLPANVLPVEVNEITQLGLETLAAAFAYGATAVRFLLRAKPRHDVSGVNKTIAFGQTIVAGLGFDGPRIASIETDDPEVLGQMLRAIDVVGAVGRPATFVAVGKKREVLQLALRELHAAAPAPVDVIALPEGAPFGKVDVNVDGCTLCLSCVSACPTGALADDPERPMLRFTEDACVQCGLCRATCPEKVITLVPQIDFRAATASSHVNPRNQDMESDSPPVQGMQRGANNLGDVWLWSIAVIIIVALAGEFGAALFYLASHQKQKTQIETPRRA